MSAQRARIAVLTATWNATQVLHGLFESLAAQTCRDFDWIIVDGASTDGTAQLARDWASRHSWISCVSERDFGFYDALNKAVALCKAPYYVVAGADDRFAADALANFLSAIEQHDADVILASVLINGRRHGGFRPERAWLGHPSVFRGSHSVGMAFRTALHERFGWYSRRLPLLADGLFLKTLLCAADVRFYNVDFVAGEFAKGGMTTTNKAQILAETWQIQLMTEPRPVFQTLLFVAKLVVRLPALVEESRLRRGG